MNDLYFTAKNQKDLQGRKTSRQAYIFAVNSMKKGKIPHLGNKKIKDTEWYLGLRLARVTMLLWQHCTKFA